MLIYIILTIIVSLIVVYFYYIKIKHPYWSDKPVFHWHNIKYWINPPGFISKQYAVLPPGEKKFLNESIEFKKYNDVEYNKYDDYI